VKEFPQQKIEKQTERTKEARFPKITKITTQRRKGRYNIFLDDKYAFAVDESILVSRLLRKGMEISPELQKELEVEDTGKKAYQRAVVYLQYSLRSEKEVREDLIKHEFADQADDVIDLLKDQRFINDLEYAKSYVRTSANLNRKGPKVIERELISKGITEQEIWTAMEEYPFSQQLENALKLGEKVIQKSSRRSSRQTRQQISQHLMQKGYSSDVINEVLPNLEFEKEEDEEWDALVLQGEKAWRRYGKFDNRERVQKTKSNLYQKGFPMELITRFTDEKSQEQD